MTRYYNRPGHEKPISRGGAVWSARMAHNHQVAGSNPAPATKKKRQPFGRRFFFASGQVRICDRLGRRRKQSVTV